MINKEEAGAVLFEHDPMADRAREAMKIITGFVKSKGLIAYGGYAINQALLKYGERIYFNDTEIPDLDVLSPDNVNHAYELANILYKAGFDRARTFAGMFAQAMKVDIGGNHFLLDITYCDTKIFSKIPSITDFSGIKCVHPTWQRIDSHGALSYPFDNPPTEVVFHRWKKDILRLNMLDAYYPAESVTRAEGAPKPAVAEFTPARKYSFPYVGAVLSGFAAYCFYSTIFEKICGEIPVNGATCRNFAVAEASAGAGASAKAKSQSVVIFDSIRGVDLVVQGDDLPEFLAAAPRRRFRPLSHLYPRRSEIKYEGQAVTMTHIDDRLLALVTWDFSPDNYSKKVRLVSIHYLMRELLTHYFVSGRAEYITYYDNLAAMIKKITARNQPNNPEDALFYPSIKYFGSSNKSLSMRISENEILNAVRGNELVSKPPFYTPSGHSADSAVPLYDYSSELFKEDGGETGEADNNIKMNAD